MKEVTKLEVVELDQNEKVELNGGGTIAYYTGYILGKLFSAYGDANPGPRQCPI